VAFSCAILWSASAVTDILDTTSGVKSSRWFFPKTFLNGNFRHLIHGKSTFITWSTIQEVWSPYISWQVQAHPRKNPQYCSKIFCSQNLHLQCAKMWCCIGRNEPATDWVWGINGNIIIIHTHLANDIGDGARCDFPHINNWSYACFDFGLIQLPPGAPVVL